MYINYSGYYTGFKNASVGKSTTAGKESILLQIKTGEILAKHFINELTLKNKFSNYMQNRFQFSQSPLKQIRLFIFSFLIILIYISESYYARIFCRVQVQAPFYTEGQN